MTSRTNCSTSPSGRRDDPVDHSLLHQQHEYVRVITTNPNNMVTVIGGLQQITDYDNVSFIMTEDAAIYAVDRTRDLTVNRLNMH